MEIIINSIIAIFALAVIYISFFGFWYKLSSMETYQRLICKVENTGSDKEFELLIKHSYLINVNKNEKERLNDLRNHFVKINNNPLYSNHLKERYRSILMSKGLTGI